MGDTVLRQLAMLRAIPPAPRKISTSMLRDRLIEEGFAVDIRTVQRDLGKLSTLFPLACDGRSKPHGWSWRNGQDRLVPWSNW